MMNHSMWKVVALNLVWLMGCAAGGDDMAAKLKEGGPAPPFALAAQDGKTYRLSDLKGKWVVLYFYPKDDTPGCTKEGCDFRDQYARVLKTGAVVLGVSKDSLESHKKFAEKFSFPFPLLSDEDAKVCTAYGAYGPKTLYGRIFKGIIRTTVVIGPDGKIRKIFPKVKVDGHVEEVLQVIEKGA